MSADLTAHSILKSELGTLEIADLAELQQLCTYIIYLSSFFHSWVNNKQYEDGGDISYATIGLWDTHHPAYDPRKVSQRHGKQVALLWTLSNVRYNPIMDVGSTELKDLLWMHREQIEPGIALDAIMMSTNI
jgi:linolenate 9R-lipoxygenase